MNCHDSTFIQTAVVEDVPTVQLQSNHPVWLWSSHPVNQTSSTYVGVLILKALDGTFMFTMALLKFNNYF